jgi:FtsP/CotA-like multicopper oxidase with cupredoxin domain
VLLNHSTFKPFEHYSDRLLGGFQELEFDFVADNPGLTLFHCHQQLHMDFGFMAIFNYG